MSTLRFTAICLIDYKKLYNMECELRVVLRLEDRGVDSSNKFYRQPADEDWTTAASLGLVYRNYVDAPALGPDWGMSFIVTMLFIK
jgi:hypothetical protein